MPSDYKLRMIVAALLLSLILAILMPLLFANLMAISLMKLRLSPHTALSIVVAMMFGGLINIPIYRTTQTNLVVDHPFSAFGLMDLWPTLRRMRRETTIAINVGGAVIPTCLATYEVVRLAETGPSAVGAVGVAVVVNVTVCYLVSKPVANVGIVMPALVPAITAAGCAYLLFPALAPPVAFVAGVMGPIIGGDMLHMKEFIRTTTGVASIGGAGTFDGIILSGILAAYLA